MKSRWIRKYLVIFSIIIFWNGSITCQEYPGDKMIPGTKLIEGFIQNSLNQVPHLKVGGIESNIYHSISILDMGVNHSISGFITIQYFDITMPDGVVIRYLFEPVEGQYIPNTDVFQQGGYGNSFTILWLIMESTMVNSIAPNVSLKNEAYKLYLNNNPFEGKSIIQGERYDRIAPEYLHKYGAEPPEGFDRRWSVNDHQKEVIDNVMRANPKVTWFPINLELTGWTKIVEGTREAYSILKSQSHTNAQNNNSDLNTNTNENVSNAETTQNGTISGAEKAELDFFGNPVKSSSSSNINTQQQQPDPVPDYNAIRKKEIDDYNANILNQAQNVANRDIEGEIQQAMSKIDKGVYSSPESMMKTGMSIMNLAQNSAEVYTGAALAGVGVLSGIANEIARAKAKREAAEERNRQRELAKAKEREIRAAVKQARMSLFSHFKNGELPVTSTPSMTQNLYYFVYAYNESEMLLDRPSITLSNVFAIGKYPDSTWPMKSKITEDIEALTPLKEIMTGPYQTLYEANLMHKMFTDNMNKVSLSSTQISLDGFNPHAEDELTQSTAPTVDFWGNALGSPKGVKSASDSTSKKVELDYWGNPIKKKGGN